MSQLMTLDDAVALAAEYGLPDLTHKWWSDQVDRRLIPAVVIKRRRRVLREHVEGYIKKQIDNLRARTPPSLMPWL